MGGAAPLRVGGVGAGPAGLCLAGALAREGGRGENVEVVVFERRAPGGDQGSGWDIDAPGRAALERAGLDVASVQRAGSDTHRLFKVGRERPEYVLHDPPLMRLLRLHGQADLETDRTRIIDGLLAALEGCPGAEVRFGAGAIDVVPCLPPAGPGGRGGAAVLGENGSMLGEFDVVIDASGSVSRLRGRRFAAGSAASYTGVSWIQGVVDSPEASLAPEIVRLLGEGTLMLAGPTRGGKGTLYAGLQRFGAVTEDRRAKFTIHPSELDTADPYSLARELGLSREVRGLVTERKAVKRVRAAILEELSEWPDDYRAIADAISGFRVLPLFMHPSDTETERLPEDGLPLLCIGDALHALPPWSGTSGNFALRDASDAATALLRLARAGAHLLPSPVSEPALPVKEHGEEGPLENPDIGVVPTLRALEASFLARADGDGYDRVRDRCRKVGRAMSEDWQVTPLESFDFIDFLTGGEKSMASTCIAWSFRFLTWLNSWDNFRMA